MGRTASSRELPFQRSDGPDRGDRLGGGEHQLRSSQDLQDDRQATPALGQYSSFSTISMATATTGWVGGVDSDTDSTPDTGFILKTTTGGE